MAALSEHLSLPKILSPGYNIYFKTSLTPPLKSINIDCAFGQAYVCSQVEPNYSETPQEVFASGSLLKAIIWVDWEK